MRCDFSKNLLYDMACEGKKFQSVRKIQKKISPSLNYTKPSGEGIIGQIKTFNAKGYEKKDILF